MVSNLPHPFRLSAHPHPCLSPAEPPHPHPFPHQTLCPPCSDLPLHLHTPPCLGSQRPRGRGLLTAAREAGGLRLCPAPLSATPKLPSTLDTLGFQIGEVGLPLGIGTPSPGRGPLQEGRGEGASKAWELLEDAGEGWGGWGRFWCP